MLSQKSKYAITSILFIAAEISEEKGLKGWKEIAESLKIPFAFTSKILQELAKKNIISSIKGPNGGFFLSKQNAQIPLIEIIELMGDGGYFRECGLGLTECSEEHPCPIHDIFKIGRDKLQLLFNTKTIGDLGKDVKESELFLVR